TTRGCLKKIDPGPSMLLSYFERKPTDRKVILLWWRCRDAGRSSSQHMARKLPTEYPGAIYHVINRGDLREAIFQDDIDRHRSVSSTNAHIWVKALLCEDRSVPSHFLGARELP